MVRPQWMRHLVPVVSVLALVVWASAGIAEEGPSAASRDAWHSCSGDRVRFVTPAGWHLAEKEVSDGLTACTLTPGPADGALAGGSVTFKHWSKWPVSAGVEPSEYAANTVQKLSRMGRVVEQHTGADGASFVYRIELVTTEGERQTHQWVLFVAHPRHATLDLVIAEWPETSWAEASKKIEVTLRSLRFADREE